ncbi:hypothetical protein HYV58_00355, partial [Candidatus Peregrinibacteria bacterium]|nr:hypothetical protein [Candidatus Peregrinibacteria bacterium]
EKLILEKLQSERSALAADAAANGEELKLIDAVLTLVRNASLRREIAAADFAKMPDEDLQKLLAKIRKETANPLALVDLVRRKRIDWAKVIEDIHLVTSKVDPYYGKGLFKTAGGFLFNSYNFDSDSNRINISGMTKQSDSKLFGYIATLVDAIEKSPQFADIDFRSFTKNKDDGGDFSSQVSFSFMLEDSSL